MHTASRITSGSLRRWAPAAIGAGVLLVAAACSSGTQSSAGGSGASGGGSGGGSGGSGGSGKTISVSTVHGVGRVLVDSSGATLYSNNRDTAAHQMCTSACQVFWHPLTVPAHSMPTAAAGAVATSLGVQASSDGRQQVTYHGKRLYTFTLDHSAGQAHGNNFSDNFNGTKFTWFAATPSGSSAKPAPAGSSAGGSGGYGGGY